MNSLENILQSLNPPQRLAVETLDGPILILAGAGSGKTKALTHRVANLIAQRKASSDQILAVTFTNKAAREMESRISRILSDLGVIITEPLWVSTFHSFCSRVLRSYAHLLDFKVGFSIYDDGDQLAMIKKIQTALNISEKVHPPKNFRSRINAAKIEGLSPDDAEKSARLLLDKESIDVYRQYEIEMKKANAMDFGDLLLKVYDLYRMYPDLLREHQEKFKYVMVDEYQDTNRIQYLLVKMLAGHHRNLCVVGDEDQSIYSWRGADISNILGFEKDFPEAVVVKLEENYRSTQTIVNAASKLIRNNSQRKDKTLFTQNPSGEPIRVHEAANEYDEAKFVARNILDLVAGGEFAWNDFAVFYRTNAQSRVLEEQFRLNSIPYQIVGGMRFFERMEVKDILSYLKVLANPSDDIAFRRIINVPTRGLGKTTLEALDESAYRNRMTLWQAAHKAVAEREFNSGTVSKLRQFLDLLEDLNSQASKMDLLSLYQTILDKTQYINRLRHEDSAEADARIENLEELSNVIAQFLKERADATLISFLEEMALVSDADQVDENLPRVTLMTLHVSKGLEFPVVFVVGWEENLFPSGRASHDEAEEASLEEERRLAYVGMTRARKKLFLSYAINRKVWGQDQYNQPSRFLKEIPLELTHFTTSQQRPSFVSKFAERAQQQQGSGSLWGRTAAGAGSSQKGLHLAPETAPHGAIHQDSSEYDQMSQAFEDESQENKSGFQKGMRVKHPTFGLGTIYQLEGTGPDLKVTVVFQDQSLKKFIAKYARLERAQY